MLILIPVHKDRFLENYSQIPEGILRLKKYLETKNILVKIAACSLSVNTENPKKSWIWLLEDGRAYPTETKIEIGGYQTIGISITTTELVTSIREFKSFLKEIRKKAPTAPFVAGGFGVWDFPFQVSGKYEDLDFVVNKWGEKPLEFIVKTIRKYGITHPLAKEEKQAIVSETPPKGIYIRYACEGVPRVYPTGDYEDIPEEALRYKHEKKESLEISTQLGCGYGKCTFCDWARLTKYRRFPIDWVIESIRMAKPKYVWINDACFLFKGADKSIEILRGLKKLRETGEVDDDFSLIYECRADAFPENESECIELLKLMKDAGTTEVHIGLESGSERVLREFKKGRIWGVPLKEKILVKQNIRAIDAMEKGGLESPWAGYFILSSPNSELTDLIKTLELITYIAKTTKFCGIAAAPGVFNSSKEPFCIEREHEPGYRFVWPSDPVATAIAISAEKRLNKLRHVGYRIYPKEEQTSVLSDISTLIDEFLSKPFLERLKNEANLIWVREEKLCEEYDKREKEMAKRRCNELALKIWKNYIAHGKYYTELRTSALKENTNLKKMLEMDNKEELRKLLLK